MWLFSPRGRKKNQYPQRRVSNLHARGAATDAAVRQAECALGRIFNQSNQIIHVTFMAGVNKICLFDLPSHAARAQEKKNSSAGSACSVCSGQTPIFLCCLLLYVNNNKSVLLHQFKNIVASAHCLRSREEQTVDFETERSDLHKYLSTSTTI